MEAKRGDSTVTELLKAIVATRAAYAATDPTKNPQAARILVAHPPTGQRGDYSPDNLLTITTTIFNSILAPLSGDEDKGQGEGQITPAELKLITLLLDINATILTPTREGDASEMAVWRSQPYNFEAPVTVVHTGGAHWERWVPSKERDATPPRSAYLLSSIGSMSSAQHTEVTVEDSLANLVASLDRSKTLPSDKEAAVAQILDITAGKIADDRLDDFKRNLLQLRQTLSTSALRGLWISCNELHKAVEARIKERTQAVAARLDKTDV